MELYVRQENVYFSLWNVAYRLFGIYKYYIYSYRQIYTCMCVYVWNEMHTALNIFFYIYIQNCIKIIHISFKETKCFNDDVFQFIGLFYLTSFNSKCCKHQFHILLISLTHYIAEAQRRAAEAHTIPGIIYSTLVPIKTFYKQYKSSNYI